jgi:hypothetical protein
MARFAQMLFDQTDGVPEVGEEDFDDLWREVERLAR